MDNADTLESTPRHELVALALEAGIERPDQLSTEQLIEAIRALGESATDKPQESIGSSWLSVARHLLATVVEQGLNLPHAAQVIRSVGLGARRSSAARQPAPLPTVTLAQIYLAQGHASRARAVLEQVLRRQPENTKARQLLDQIEAPAPAPQAPSDELASSPGFTQNQNTPTAPSRPVADQSRDDLVILLDGKTGHVCWELGPTSSELALDHGLELRVKEFIPGMDGVRVLERSFPVTTARGAVQLPLRDDSASRDLVRAALVAPFSTSTLRAASVLAVASLHQIETNQPPFLIWASRPGRQGGDFPAQALSRIQG